MTEPALEPANSIIERFGGNMVVRSITGVSRTRVYRWTRPKSEGGTGGLIPTDHAITLLRYAKKHGVEVSAADFLPIEEPA
ncbi:MAG TPA: hypothetical protein VGN60_00895 [Devosia sp.]|jgi:hypothetical protein|nr:hypothetical protein [Devosia sp.]